MINDKVMQEYTERQRVYYLDMADQMLEELVNEFIIIGNASIASMWANMRVHLYQCGKELGIDDTKRVKKFKYISESASEQQKLATKLIENG